MCMCMPGREDVGMEVGSESWRAVSKDAVPNSCSFFLLIFLLPPQGRAGPRVCPEAFSWCLSHPESECRGTLSGTFTRSRGAMPSAGPRARCRG